MVQLRRILSLAVCFSVCLIVCVSPVYANLMQTISYVNGGFFYPSAVSPFYFVDSSGSNFQVFNGYMNASFSNDEFDTGTWEFYSDSVGDAITTLISVQDSYIEILFNVKQAIYFSVTTQSTGQLNVGYSSSSTSARWDAYFNSCELVCDGNYYPCTVNQYMEFKPPVGDYRVARYFGYRFVFDSHSYNVNNKNDVSFYMELMDNSTFAISEWPEGDVIGSIDVNTGVLQEINGNVSDIKTQLTELNRDVSDIKDTLSDTHDQLENPDSNIWQAAGSAISGAIESLFVPSEQDIANVKQGFDDLAQDKLGGAYTAMETVEDTIAQVNDKLNNPSAAEGVEFPGIAVPLGGEVGTVVLAERQMVTLPMELTAILHPLGGTIISIIAGLGTFNVLKDMVECFLSGFSYAEYLHRNKGGSDE